jgi:hypothetical protein
MPNALEFPVGKVYLCKLTDLENRSVIVVFVVRIVGLPY